MGGAVQGEVMRNRQRQRDLAFLVTCLAALALMAVAMVSLPRPAHSEPYQVPKQPIFTNPIPACIHREILFKALSQARHPQTWTGLDESHPAQLALFVHRKTGTWFLVAIRQDSVLACIMARGNESRLQFGEPS